MRVGAVIGFAVLGLLYVPQLATISATFPAMFPTHVRYAGFAIAYNVSTSIFGGTAPAVNDWLVNRTGDNLVPAYYMMAACVIGAIALIKVPETTRCPIERHGDARAPPEAPPQLEYQKQPSRRVLTFRPVKSRRIIDRYGTFARLIEGSLSRRRRRRRRPRCPPLRRPDRWSPRARG